MTQLVKQYHLWIWNKWNQSHYYDRSNPVCDKCHKNFGQHTGNSCPNKIGTQFWSFKTWAQFLSQLKNER